MTQRTQNHKGVTREEDAVYLWLLSDESRKDVRLHDLLSKHGPKAQSLPQLAASTPALTACPA